MKIQFYSAQPVQIPVPDQPVPIQHYLRQPQRLVKALVDPSRIEILKEDSFRLKMRPLHFMHLSLQPTVDLKVWAESDGTVRLKSVNCEIRGIEFINQRFDLDLVGYLSPVLIAGVPHLQGNADLTVGVELPPPFWLTPKPILEATGNGLLKSVLLTVKQRLTHQLIADYCQWAASDLGKSTLGKSAQSSAVLPVQS